MNYTWTRFDAVSNMMHWYSPTKRLHDGRAAFWVVYVTIQNHPVYYVSLQKAVAPNEITNTTPFDTWEQMIAYCEKHDKEPESIHPSGEGTMSLQEHQDRMLVARNDFAQKEQELQDTINILRSQLEKETNVKVRTIRDVEGLLDKISELRDERDKATDDARRMIEKANDEHDKLQKQIANEKKEGDKWFKAYHGAKRLLESVKGNVSNFLEAP